MKAPAAILSLAALAAPALAAAPAATQHPEPRAKPAVVDDDTWHLRDTLTGGHAEHSFRYGTADEDARVMGDWDGDGTATPGVVRSEGDRDGDGTTELVWYLHDDNAGGPADIVLTFGERQNSEQRDTPVVGDWDGDGVDTVGVVRQDYDRNVHRWLLRNSNTSGAADVSFEYGRPDNYGTLSPRQPRGVPVVGDWDGDGITTPGINHQHPEEGTNRWLLRNANDAGPADLDFFFGTGDDAPLVGDWDGDGTETVGVHRLPNHWYVTNRHTGGPAEHHFRYGALGMRPLVWY